MVYIWSRLLQLTIESRDLAQAETKILLLQPEKFKKSLFSLKTVILLSVKSFYIVICENLNFSIVHPEKFKFSQILLGDKNATYLCSKVMSTLTTVFVLT